MSVGHGKASAIEHDEAGLFDGLPNPIEAGRYRSLAATEEITPPLDSDRAGDVVMGVRHESLPQFGVRFHPESVLTEAGKRLTANFVAIAEDGVRSGGECCTGRNW